MGSSLKEALKCLCGDKQWSYAVFWKIGCRNPSLLVWEECYYEPAPCSTLSGISGVDSKELLLKEWERILCYNNHLSQHGSSAVDRVSSLINKMMNNQVHVVGEGIVGRAAFTRSHQWILRETHIGNHPSEVMAEVHQQFSAGMQTVAVIPVLPHGVVQLGSCRNIMEDMRFVNEVKGLFVQLGSVPGALWSEIYTEREVSQKFGEPFSLEVPTSADCSRNSCSQVGKFTPSTGDTCSQQISTSWASITRPVSQPSHSFVGHMQGNVPTNALKLQTTPAMAKSCNGLFHSKALSVMKQNFPSNGQLDNGDVGVEMILPNPDTWPSQRALHSPRFGLNHELLVGQSGATSCSPTSMEQQVLSDSGLQRPVNNSLHALDSIKSYQLRPNRETHSNSLNDSVILSLLEKHELSNSISSSPKLTSNPCTRLIPYRSAGINSSSSSSRVSHLSSSVVLPEVYEPCYPSTSNKYAQSELAARKQRIENDLFQALNIPSAHIDEHNSMHVPVPDFIHDCWVNGQKHNKASLSSGDIVCQDAQLQSSSGNDLFDILGLDFKSGLSERWSDLHIHEADASTRNLDMYVSTCTTQLDPGPNSYAANDEISESGILSQSRPDHLLDAVVSKIFSSAKQNSDDTESCRTTLTKISGSSIPTGSPKYSQTSVCNQIQVDFGLPPHLAKAGMVGSSSSKSGCSKGNIGECSQINSIYGSQISSWVEEGQNVKRDNSIVTACSKRPDEITKSNRKRLRPGESPRPRPKDRQMIQDRVKELREIVPNGAKCSIDALLERTIKHMLFLQSVTKHADKLKQTGESKIISKDGGLMLRDNFEGGATWAFELGSQSMVCPIIVEDLNPPRQMLVEMLCEERGFFLEIADLIRGLGLTILKGVMEARNDKIWARFAVEANRDVTRMEIFLSLVRLLEQIIKSSGSSKGIDNGSTGVNHSLHPISIPATGPSNALQ